MAVLRTEKAVMRAMCGVKNLYEFAGFDEYFGWTSHCEWSTIVWACFEKSVGF